ncbi:hypothetical protein Dimus_036074 [Dionaea muscipula]
MMNEGDDGDMGVGEAPAIASLVSSIPCPLPAVIDEVGQQPIDLVSPLIPTVGAVGGHGDGGVVSEEARAPLVARVALRPQPTDGLGQPPSSLVVPVSGVDGGGGKDGSHGCRSFANDAQGFESFDLVLDLLIRFRVSGILILAGDLLAMVLLGRVAWWLRDPCWSEVLHDDATSLACSPATTLEPWFFHLQRDRAGLVRRFLAVDISSSFVSMSPPPSGSPSPLLPDGGESDAGTATRTWLMTKRARCLLSGSVPPSGLLCLMARLLGLLVFGCVSALFGLDDECLGWFVYGSVVA